MEMICGNCRTRGEPIEIRPKNTGDGGLLALAVLVGVVGIFVWPLLLLAGVLAVLAVVRMVGSQVKALGVEAYECRTCKARQMVPLDSPAGAELAARAKE